MTDNPLDDQEALNKRRAEIRKHFGDDYSEDDWFPDALADWIFELEKPREQLPTAGSIVIEERLDPTKFNKGDMVYRTDEGEFVKATPAPHPIPFGIAFDDSVPDGLDEFGNQLYSAKVLIQGGFTLRGNLSPDHPFAHPPYIQRPKVSRWLHLRQEWVYWSWRISEAWKRLWTK